MYLYIGLHTVPSVGKNRLLFTSFHKYIYYIHWFFISIKYTIIYSVQLLVVAITRTSTLIWATEWNQWQQSIT